jgi:hypothetical protein
VAINARSIRNDGLLSVWWRGHRATATSLHHACDTHAAIACQLPGTHIKMATIISSGSLLIDDAHGCEIRDLRFFLPLPIATMKKEE